MQGSRSRAWLRDLPRQGFQLSILQGHQTQVQPEAGPSPSPVGCGVLDGRSSVLRNRAQSPEIVLRNRAQVRKSCSRNRAQTTSYRRRKWSTKLELNFVDHFRRADTRKIEPSFVCPNGTRNWVQLQGSRSQAWLRDRPRHGFRLIILQGHQTQVQPEDGPSPSPVACAVLID